ncbi:MAG TPA: hypothetical protein VHD87_04005 [Acidimicrobiales bacterium]|nr:hypothetical protein [Acidimicrobiales bacterium]
MTIARVFEAKGWTAAQYDELIAKLVADLGLAPGRSAPGVLFHWAAATDEGMRAVDVYESREAADTLVQDHIGPIAGALGLPLPEITELEVHNFLAVYDVRA